MHLMGKVIFYALAIAAFTTHLVLASHVTRLKGTTFDGYQKDGRFYVSNHGTYHEVSEFDWRTLERVTKAAMIATIAFAAYSLILIALRIRSQKSLNIF